MHVREIEYQLRILDGFVFHVLVFEKTENEQKDARGVPFRKHLRLASKLFPKETQFVKNISELCFP